MQIQLTPELTNLTGRIISAAMEVHNHLGPGLPEEYYQKALEHELALNKIAFASQAPVQVVYKDVQVGMNYLDFVVEERIVVEIKSVRDLDNVHMFQVIKYLAATDYPLALLINFGPAKCNSNASFHPGRCWTRGRRKFTTYDTD